MKQQSNVDLFLYWDSVRQGGDGSDGAAAAPRELRNLLAGTFLLDADNQRAYPLRVIGSGVERFAANARVGGPFLDWWDSESRSHLESALCAVHDENMPVVLGVISLADPRRRTRAEVLLLPLARSANGKASVLGGLAPVGTNEHTAAPGRLAIVSSRIFHPPLVAPMRRPPTDHPPPRPSHPARRSGDRSHLRVIKGGLNSNRPSLSSL